MEPVNKSSVFSAGYRTARCAKDRAVKCLDLFKRSDKADGRYRARPSGLSERMDRGVSDFRQTTSMSVIAALTSNRSESQRRKGLVHRFPRPFRLYSPPSNKAGSSMKICSVELKSNEAILCLLSLSEGLFSLPDCRARRLTLTDVNSSEHLKKFQFDFAKLMNDYKVDRVVIRQRPTSGKFSGSAVGFKLEAAIQLIDGLDVETVSSTMIKESLKHTPLPIPFSDTGLKGFQEVAFTTAVAYMNRPKED